MGGFARNGALVLFVRDALAQEDDPAGAPALKRRPGRVCPKQVLPAEKKRQLSRTKPATADGSFISTPGESRLDRVAA